MDGLLRKQTNNCTGQQSIHTDLLSGYNFAVDFLFSSYIHVTEMAGRTTQHDECECPVCQEDYVDPKLLGCGHIICRQCVLTWLQAGGLQNGCPICRAAIISPRKGISETSSDLATLIDSLPTDVAVISMVECKQLLKGSHVCCVCDDNTSAFTVCMDCNIKLCQSCSKSHRKVPALREHVLEELVTLTPERLAALRKSSCDVHKERPAELYCPTHQSLVCVLCSSSTHRSCHDVTVLSDFANSERQTLKMQCERLRQIKTSLEEQNLQLEQKICDVQAQSKVRKNEVKAMCDRLKQAVDRQCQILWNSVEVDSEVIVSKVNVEKSELNIRHASVAAHVFVADRLVTTAADGSLVKTLPNVKASMSALESQTVIQSPIKENVVSFDSEMLNRLEKAVTVFEKMVATDVKVKKCQVPYECNPEESDELKLKCGSKKEKSLCQESRVSKSGLSSSVFVEKMENKDERNKGEEAAAKSAKPPLRLVLLGNTGVGKSSLGNVLLERKDSSEEGFVVCHGMESGTQTCCSKIGYNTFLRRYLEVIDTPGIFDTCSMNLMKTLQGFTNMLSLSVPGPHAVLFLVRCDIRFTIEEKQAFDKIKSSFNDRVLKHMVVIFTHGNELKVPVHTLIDRSESLKKVLELVENKYTVMSKTEDMDTRKSELNSLFNMIDKLSKDGEDYYSDSTLKNLTENISKEALRKVNKEHISYEEAFQKAKEEINDDLLSRNLPSCILN